MLFHESVLGRALVMGRHCVRPELRYGLRQKLHDVEKIDDVDGIREEFPSGRGVAVIHVGDEILHSLPVFFGDFAELLPEMREPPARVYLDDLAPLPVVCDAYVGRFQLGFVRAHLYLVDAHDSRRKPARNALEPIIEKGGHLRVGDVVSSRDGGEGKELAAVEDYGIHGLARELGVWRDAR